MKEKIDSILYVTFFLGETRCAFPARLVHEIIPYLPLDPVDGACDFVVGSCNYRGFSVDVVDMSLWQEGRVSRKLLSTRIAILSRGEQSFFGLILEGLLQLQRGVCASQYRLWTQEEIYPEGFAP